MIRCPHCGSDNEDLLKNIELRRRWEIRDELYDIAVTGREIINRYNNNQISLQEFEKWTLEHRAKFNDIVEEVHDSLKYDKEGRKMTDRFRVDYLKKKRSKLIGKK